MKDPSIVGVADGWNAITIPSRIVLQFFLATPILKVERRVGDDELELLVLELILPESVGVLLSEISGNSSYPKIHLC